MVISSATSIYFSPTGTTKKVINAIVKGMGTTKNTLIDLNSSDVRNTFAPIIDEDIVIIGVPVYGNFGDGRALNELDSITKKSGFKVVAAGSFIGEHSFSTNKVPVQEGRPNYEDLNMAEEFGISIIEEMSKVHNLDDIRLEIPKGKLPLMAKVLPKNSARLFTKTPFVDMNICNQCGVCAKLCPMNAIYKDTLVINENECIRCFCCVKRCHLKARKIIYRPSFIVSKILRAKNKIKRTPQIFLKLNRL